VYHDGEGWDRHQCVQGSATQGSLVANEPVEGFEKFKDTVAAQALQRRGGTPWAWLNRELLEKKSTCGCPSGSGTREVRSKQLVAPKGGWNWSALTGRRKVKSTKPEAAQGPGFDPQRKDEFGQGGIEALNAPVGGKSDGRREPTKRRKK